MPQLSPQAHFRSCRTRRRVALKRHYYQYPQPPETLLRCSRSPCRAGHNHCAAFCAPHPALSAAARLDNSTQHPLAVSVPQRPAPQEIDISRRCHHDAVGIQSVPLSPPAGMFTTACRKRMFSSSSCRSSAAQTMNAGEKSGSRSFSYANKISLASRHGTPDERARAQTTASDAPAATATERTGGDDSRTWFDVARK